MFCVFLVVLFSGAQATSFELDIRQDVANPWSLVVGLTALEPLELYLQHSVFHPSPHGCSRFSVFDMHGVRLQDQSPHALMNPDTSKMSLLAGDYQETLVDLSKCFEFEEGLYTVVLTEFMGSSNAASVLLKSSEQSPSLRAGRNNLEFETGPYGNTFIYCNASEQQDLTAAVWEAKKGVKTINYNAPGTSWVNLTFSTSNMNKWFGCGTGSCKTTVRAYVSWIWKSIHESQLGFVCGTAATWCFEEGYENTVAYVFSNDNDQNIYICDDNFFNKPNFWTNCGNHGSGGNNYITQPLALVHELAHKYYYKYDNKYGPHATDKDKTASYSQSGYDWNHIQGYDWAKATDNAQSYAYFVCDQRYDD